MGQREGRSVTPGPEKSEARPLQCQCVTKNKRRRPTRPTVRKTQHIEQADGGPTTATDPIDGARAAQAGGLAANPTMNGTGQPAREDGDYELPATAQDPTDFAGSVARTGAFRLANIEWGPSGRPPIGSADQERSEGLSGGGDLSGYSALTAWP